MPNTNPSYHIVQTGNTDFYNIYISVIFNNIITDFRTKRKNLFTSTLSSV